VKFFDPAGLDDFAESYCRGARRWFFLAGGFICLILAFGLVGVFQGKFAPPEAEEADPPEFAPGSYSAAPSAESPLALVPAAEESDWVIYITGAVKRPGVYEVPRGSRVNDALLRAGGFSPHADPEAVNLASRLEDGVHVHVPSRNERERTETYSASSSGGNLNTGAGSSAAVTNSRPAPPAYSSNPGDGKLDINRALARDLARLPGIGPKLAEAIVSHREKNGPFERVDDLTLVRGIGAKRLEAIRDLVRTEKRY
jgi:competence protein ComEA